MTKVVLLGPEGATFTYGAYGQIASLFGAPEICDAEVISVSRNYHVPQTLKEHGGYGLLAIESGVGGRVNESLEAFIDITCYGGIPPISIIGAARLPLSFALMTQGLKLGQIQKVIAHRQALIACDKEIRQHGWDSEESLSNGQAAKDVSTLPVSDGCAALGPIEAARAFGLSVVDKSFAKGVTTFFLLQSGAVEATFETMNRAVMVFRTKRGPGALCDVLMAFKLFSINLRHIHSVGKTEEIYDFVATAECTQAQIPNLMYVIAALEQVTDGCAVFGPFPFRSL